MNQRDEENQVLNEYCRTESCVTGTEDFVHPVILSGFVRPGILTIFGLLIAACIRVVFLLLTLFNSDTTHDGFEFVLIPLLLGLGLLQVLFISTVLYIVTYFVLNLLVPHKQRLLFLFYLTATFYCIFSGFFSFVWHLPFFRNLIEHKGVSLVLFIQFIACWIVSVCFASVVAFFTKKIDVCLRINRMFAKINRFAGIVAAGLFAVASMIVLVYLLLIES